MKLIIKSVLLLSALFFIKNFCEKQTQGFTITSISSNRSFDKKWAAHSLSPPEEYEFQRALEQTYLYYDSGGQSFVFLSENGDYAIKFFKQRYFHIPQWLHYVPVPLLQKYKAKKARGRIEKLKRDFTSYKIAFDEMQEETGIVYLHLNKTTDLNKKLTIKDLLNIEHRIDLDEFDFVIQKRAELAYDYINRTMLQGNVKEAKKAITNIIELIIRYSQKGCYDRDPNIRTNCGMLDNKPILIDVGKLIKDEEMKTREKINEVLLEICQPFNAWLQRRHPILAVYLEEELLKQLDAHE